MRLSPRPSAALVALLFLVAGCIEPAAAEVSVMADDDGRTITLQKGQSMQVTLPSNPSTGYSWKIHQVAEKILARQGESTFTERADCREGMTGCGGVQSLRFRAASEGQTALEMVYKRSFGEAGPANWFNLTVEVQ